MSVHYKFKSALEYDTVTFDGLHISVKDLKKAILQQKKIGKTSDFDLQVTNAQTKETYTDENVLIPKNASLIVARVPLTQQQRKQWEKEKLAAANKPGETSDQNNLSQVDISSLDVSEEEKIKTMITQSTSDYDPSNYVKIRGGNQVGTVPASYICFRCHQHGHWIKDCPSAIDSSNMGLTDTIKKSTGIPRSFMIQVEGPQVPGARMTPSGVYAVPAIDHEVYKEKKIEKPPFLAEKEKPVTTPTIPEDLICGICKDLLQDAVMIPCCGISFCDECIRNALVDSEESECPDCNEKNVSPDTMIPNRFLRNSVNTFKNKTGYVKAKSQLIQQRPPSPPRPSLPDFVPPPDYVESTTGKDAQPSTTVKADESPIFHGSPSTALQIHHSPLQSQTTPIYNERSPFGDNSNSSHPDHDNQAASQQSHSQQTPSLPPQTHTQYPSYGSNQYHRGPPPNYQRPTYGPRGPYQGGYRHQGYGHHYQNYNRPSLNFAGRFADPNRYHGDVHAMNWEGKDSQVNSSNTIVKIESDHKDEAKQVEKIKGDSAGQNSDKENCLKGEKDTTKSEKLKKAGIDVDDVSSVSSNASEEPPPPVENNHRPNEGPSDPSQGPSYAIPSLFSGQHPVILPPPNSDLYPPLRPGDHYAHSGVVGDRSGTPTVDERLEIPPVRPPYDPYRPLNYMGPGYDQHYGMPPHPAPMPYDPNMMYDRGYRGMSRGPRMHRGRYAMRQPPPPGSRPISPPRNEEEAFLAFQRMLKEKEERDKRKNEKLKSRRSTSRSRSRSPTRSRRSFSGGRSRSRTRSRTPRRSRSRSKKRSRTRSRSFVISRSRSRSYSRSPLHERNYSPRKYYSPHRSPLRYESNYGQWSQDHRDYRRGRHRGRGGPGPGAGAGRGGRFYKSSPPRGPDHQSYSSLRVSLKTQKKKGKWENIRSQPQPQPPGKQLTLKKAFFRYRDENYVSTSPRQYRSPSRYYDQRMSPGRCGEYPKEPRDRDFRSYERDTESAVRDRPIRRRSHSNSVIRNQLDVERDRDRERERDRERDRDRERRRDRDRERETDYRRRSRSRRSRSRKYSPGKRMSQDRNKDKSPERRKDWDRDKDRRQRNSRDKSLDKEKRRRSGDRDRSKDLERESKRRERTRSRSKEKGRRDNQERSRSKEKKKRSPSRDKSKVTDGSIRKRKSTSRHRSSSKAKEENGDRPQEARTGKDGHKKRSESMDKDKERKMTAATAAGEVAAVPNDEPLRSPNREKTKEQTKSSSPKVTDKDEEDKKDKRKDKERKKKKKEKETDEERAARKKKKKEKKEEKKRKQEMKTSETKDKVNEDGTEPEPVEGQSKVKVESSIADNPNFVSTFSAVITEEPKQERSGSLEASNEEHKEELAGSIEYGNESGKAVDGVPEDKESVGKEMGSEEEEKHQKRVTSDDNSEGGSEDIVGGKCRDDEVFYSARDISGPENEGNLEDDRMELQIHASYDSLLEESSESQKKGILASVPEISKWELDESQASDTHPSKTNMPDAKSPEFPAKVTREVIKRAENAIFKKAVNAIREPAKKTFEKEEKKERKVTVGEKDRTKEHKSGDQESDKAKRLFLTREKDKYHRSSIEVPKAKTEVKRTINSLQITIPLNNDGESAEREFSVDEEKSNAGKTSSKSPPTGRVPIKERLGSKVDKHGRHSSPHIVRTVDKRSRTLEEEETGRRDYHRINMASTIGSIDSKRSSIDEAHFVPNYDESSDEENRSKRRPSTSREKEMKPNGGGGEGKKRQRSTSETSAESLSKKHKKKRSKTKKSKKAKRSRKHGSAASSDSSESDREDHKKKHKKSKKKKKSKH